MISLKSDEIKIKALAYDKTHAINTSITDGINFNFNDNFLLISNKYIPKNSKVYIEIEISYYSYHADIRHIPIMVGIHKEPSAGILNSDCCLGAIYYTKSSWYSNSNEYLAFRIIEKYSILEITNRFNNRITARPPIRNSIIGIGVDMPNNLITIYSDGVKFYSFSPYNFNMNDEENVYFALYSSEANKQITGRINFGQFGTKYLPTGYLSLYYEWYLKEQVTYDINSRIYVGYRYLENNGLFKELLNGYLTLENDVVPVQNNRRDIELVLHNDNMIYYTNLNKTKINKHAFQFTPKEEDLDYAYMNFPLDKFKKVYCEFTCTSADLINDYIGIPLSIGITKILHLLLKLLYKLIYII